MKLLSLQLENFRNYRRYEFEFPKDKNLTVLIGENGKGKTNLLEAIYFLSLSRSFRTGTQDDLIDWEMDYFRCTGEVETDEETANLEAFYSNYPRKHKSLKRNDVPQKSSEYVGNLLTVLFHPNDLDILYLSPSLRRKYIDILLSQTDRKYLISLSNYKKTLKQRNALLASIREARFSRKPTATLEANLDAWNQEIAEFGTEILEKRQHLIDFFDKNLEKTYRKISGNNEIISLEYESSVLKKKKSLAKKEIHTLYLDELFNRKSRDIMQAKTTVGPHRDDLKFFINDKEITGSASRGEFRTLLLALKLAEIEYIKKQTDKNPILLLDDVFSELDLNRRKHLLEAIKGCQVVITTTDLSDLKELKESSLLEIVKVG